MTAPVPYQQTFNFQQDEANAVAGRSTIRTAQLDTELANIAATLAGVLTNRSAIQRDDLELLDKIVKMHTLSPEVIALCGSAGFTVHDPVVWATGIAYPVRDMVTHSGATYVCAAAHTSGVFATDLAAGKWLVMFDPASYTASAIVNVPAGNITSSNVQAALNELDTIKAPAAEAVGGSHVRGLMASVTTNQSMTIAVDEVSLVNPAGRGIVRLVPAAIVCNVGNVQSGSVANGRDQTSIFGANEFIHFFLIWNGTTLASLASGSPLFPTLPPGYTHKAYCYTARYDGTQVIENCWVRGAWLYRGYPQQVLTNGQNISPTFVDCSAYVPANALAFRVEHNGSCLADGSGVVDAVCHGLHISSGSPYNLLSQLIQGGVAPSAGVGTGLTIYEHPNVNLGFYYAWAVTTGGPGSLYSNVLGYRCPNGGE